MNLREEGIFFFVLFSWSVTCFWHVCLHICFSTLNPFRAGMLNTWHSIIQPVRLPPDLCWAPWALDLVLDLVCGVQSQSQLGRSRWGLSQPVDYLHAVHLSHRARNVGTTALGPCLHCSWCEFWEAIARWALLSSKYKSDQDARESLPWSLCCCGFVTVAPPTCKM